MHHFYRPSGAWWRRLPGDPTVGTLTFTHIFNWATGRLTAPLRPASGRTASRATVSSSPAVHPVAVPDTRPSGPLPAITRLRLGRRGPAAPARPPPPPLP